MAKKFFNIIPSADGPACLLLYGPIGEQEKVDPAAVVSELITLQQQYDKIDIRINSVGGEVFAGIAIFNALRSSKADMTIYVDGVAASIAAIIALCGKPLYMSNHARLMLHKVRGGEYGTADQLREAAVTMEQLEGTLAEMIAAKCKLTPEDVRSRYFSGGDNWITAKEAQDMGLIDGIYDINDPGVPGESATSDDIYQFFTNRLASQPIIHTKEMAFIDELKARPSFKDAADEAQLMQRIVSLENQAAKVQALEGRVAELTSQLDESKKAAHTAYLNQAVADGRISQAQVPAFLSLLATDEENTRAVIDSIQARNTSVESFIHQGGQQKGLLNMSWDEIDKAGRLAELKNQFPEAYKKKFDETFKK